MNLLGLDARTGGLTLGVLASATALALVSTIQAGVWMGHAGAAVPWQGLLKARLVDWYCYALFFPLLWRLAGRTLRDGGLSALLLHLGASFPIAASKEALYVTIGNWFRPGVFDLTEILAEDFASELFSVWALMAVAHALRHALAGPTAPPDESSSPAPSDRLVVRDRGGRRLIGADQVSWIDAQGNYARLHTLGGARHLIRETMASLEQRLGPDFVRVHRGAIVSAARVARVESRSGGRYRLILDCGTAIDCGQAYSPSVRRRLL